MQPPHVKIEVLSVLNLVSEDVTTDTFERRYLPVNMHHVELQELGHIHGDGWGIRH